MLLCGPISASASTQPQSPEQKYLDEKKAGDFGSALSLLQEWTLSLDDPALIEVNLFRIRELMVYPELYDRGLLALNSISEKAPAARFLRDRISIMRAWLLLKKGELRAAEMSLARLSFLDFRMMGPFTYGVPEEFGTPRCPERVFDPKQTCSGPGYGITWHTVAPDRMGLVDIGSLYGNTAGSLYYLYRDIRIEKEGDYFLVLGKTGYTDLWVDGTRLFTDRTLHGFDHDQYFIPVRLTAGVHGILIKAGASPNGFAVSLRLSETDDGPGFVQGASSPPALASLMHRQNPGPVDSFRAGYFLLESRRPAQANSEAAGLLSLIQEGDTLYSAASLYLGRACPDRDRAAGYYGKSIKADPDNREALLGLACIAMDRDLFYDAFPYISMMKKSGRTPALYDESIARLFLKMEWAFEARRHAAALKRSPFPSAGLRVDEGIFRSEGDLYHESLALGRLVELDQYDRDLLMSYAAAIEKSGDLDSAALVLQGAAALFPNDTVIKLRLASVVQNSKGAGSALPYLAAALNTAPGNPELLRALGMAYLNLGKIGPAGYYLRQALQRDPGNSTIMLNLDIINDSRAR